MTRPTTCQVARCGHPVSDGFVCKCCAAVLGQDLRRIISGHQADVIVVEVAADVHRVVDTTSRPSLRGHRAGAAMLAREVVPGQYGRHLSTPLDHNGGLAHDLNVTLSREARLTSGGRRGTTETALPWHERAGDLRRRLSSTLVSYARQIAATRQVALPDAAELLTLADWMLRHVEWLRGAAFGASAVTDITNVVDEALRVIDRAAERWYAGPCTAEPENHPGGYCAEDLYVRLGATVAACRRCNAEYPVKDRRAWLLTAAEDYLAHAEFIGRALSAFGVPVTPASIRGYAHRGRLAVKGHDPLGRPLYRIGDVLTVATTAQEQRDRRAANKAG